MSAMMDDHGLCPENDRDILRFIICEDGPLSQLTLNELDTVLWDSRIVTADDKQRWLSQGIHSTVSISSVTSETSPLSPQRSIVNAEEIEATVHQWGLKQTFGGPCGVLAAIQAELLALLLFGQDLSCRLYESTVADTKVSLRVFPDSLLLQHGDQVSAQMKGLVDSTLMRRAIATAIGWILARAAMAPVTSSNTDQNSLFLQAKVKLVLPTNFISSVNCQDGQQRQHSNIKTSEETSSSLRCMTLMLNNDKSCYSVSEFDFPIHNELVAALSSSSSENLRFQVMSLLAYCVADYLQSSQAISQYIDSEGGVVRFTQSLVLTRGISQTQQGLHIY